MPALSWRFNYKIIKTKSFNISFIRYIFFPSLCPYFEIIILFSYLFIPLMWKILIIFFNTIYSNIANASKYCYANKSRRFFQFFVLHTFSERFITFLKNMYVFGVSLNFAFDTIALFSFFFTVYIYIGC